MATIHNKVTNGKTKLMIFVSIILLGLLGTLALCFAFTLHFNGADSNMVITYINSIVVKTVFGQVAVTCIGGLIYAVKSFFDTRETHEKHQDKLSKQEGKRLANKDKYDYKLALKQETLKFKLENKKSTK